jgi:hypothetical protein
MTIAKTTFHIHIYRGFTHDVPGMIVMLRQIRVVTRESTGGNVVSPILL